VCELAKTKLLRSTAGNGGEKKTNNNNTNTNQPNKNKNKKKRINKLEAGLSNQGCPGGPWCFLVC
jgi:hypothetical protein